METDFGTVRRRIQMAKKDYSKEPLTLKILGSGQIVNAAAGTTLTPFRGEYRKNGGEWITSKFGTTPIDVIADDIIQFRFHDSSTKSYFYLNQKTTAPFIAYGNIASVATLDELGLDSPLPSKSHQLFGSSPIVSAQDLILPTNLTKGCYTQTFMNCTNLIAAPQLPATTLAENCYGQSSTYGMFSGCTSLTKAPDLPALNLAKNCYFRMFYGCSSLQYIKAMFLTTPGYNYTYNWLSGVPATGIFVKNSAATWSVSGVSGIPTGWTIQNA